MKVGERIKLRRIELGLTQEELAQRLGYKSKSSINKIEMGVQDLPQKKISAFAEALDTTPSQLMGWENQPMTFLASKQDMTDAVNSLVNAILEKQEQQQINASVNKPDNKDDMTPVYYTNPETAKLAQEMFDDPELRSLFHMKRNTDPERFKAYMDMIRKLYKMEHPEDSDDFNGC